MPQLFSLDIAENGSEIIRKLGKAKRRKLGQP